MLKYCIFERGPMDQSCRLSENRMICFKDECPIWVTMKMVEKIADKDGLIEHVREGDLIKLEDLNGYAMKDLKEYPFKDDIFVDPKGRRYKKRDCDSEVCAQGCSGCNCQGSGYRFDPIDD